MGLGSTEEGAGWGHSPFPRVMALEKGPLLLLALGLGLAGAQKALEEVPVQPDFDAQKVSVMGPVPRLGLGTRAGDDTSVTLRRCRGWGQVGGGWGLGPA